jgi:hypothetical protein
MFSIPRRQTILLLAVLAATLVSCASSPRAVRVLPVTASADVPYKKILVIGLGKSFDTRRYFEKELVDRLGEMGTEAVASTSMMNTKTPVTRETFVQMVDEIGADAVLVSRLVTVESNAKMIDANPLFKRSIHSTYYYNLYEVTMSEYEEPETIRFKHTVKLATQLISVASKGPVWAIESEAKAAQDITHDRIYSIFVDNAESIAKAMRQDGLIARY